MLYLGEVLEPILLTFEPSTECNIHAALKMDRKADSYLLRFDCIQSTQSQGQRRSLSRGLKKAPGMYHDTIIDRIEFNVTVQISDLQHGVCAHVRMCVRACAVEIKLGMLRAVCLIDVGIWTRIRFALQDGDFHSKKGVVQYGLYHL